MMKNTELRYRSLLLKSAKSTAAPLRGAKTDQVAVLGAGAWGITLSAMLAKKGLPVTLWEFNPGSAAELKRKRALGYFPHVKLPKTVSVTSSLSAACSGRDFIIIAVPSHVFRSVAKALKSSCAGVSGARVISAVKGIENGSLKRMSQIFAQETGPVRGFAVLSGPTIAREVASGKPAAAAIASKDPVTAKLCQRLLMSPSFRIYTSSDVAGVEAGGSLKNVFAVAAGIIDGLGLGQNTKAALISRGMREMVKLGMKMGAKPATLFGLSGLGDLIVTSSSPDSRNRRLGEKLAQGKSVRKAEKEIIMVAEGVKTAKSACALAKKYGLELPIINQVYAIIYKHKKPSAAIQELMSREAKPEQARIGNVTI